MGTAIQNNTVTQANSLFQQPWWLDAVAPGRWNEIVIIKGDDLLLRFPYVVEKRNGYTGITMPAVTQTLGPWLKPMNGRQSSQLSLQKELMTELIQQLPPHDFFYQRFHYSISNWLPFYWKGFTQTTRYTYVIEDLSDLDALWTAMKPNIRNKIRKAEKCGIEVVETDDMDAFLDLCEMTFKRQGMPLPFSRSFAHSINNASARRNARKIYITFDKQGRAQTGLFCVFDGHAMYNLLQGGDPALRGSGANALAMWESIKFAAGVTRVYDFEGSMIEPIEEFFSSFGGIQKPYFEISKVNSINMKIRSGAKDLLKLLLKR